jgi:RNA polymerase sigma-70 factor (ECF subfamily)
VVAYAGGVDEAYRAYYGHVYRYFLHRTGNRSEAEDLTQDVFAAAVRDLTGPAPVLPWLYRVAQRRYVDALRRNGHSASCRLEDVLDSRESGEAAGSALRAALRSLPPGQAEVVGMRLLQGRPFDEIAAALSTSEAACKMRFRRAMRTLRVSLERGGFGPGSN